MAKGHGASPRHEEHEEHEEHVNHEAWVIPYADMLTLLMALFLVLFAIGRTDAAKAKLAAESFKSQLDGSAHVVSLGGQGGSPVVGGNGVLDNAGAAVPTTGLTAGVQPVQVGPANIPSANGGSTTTTPADRALAEQQLAVEQAQESADSLEAVQQLLEAAAAASGISDEVAFDLQARGLVVTIITDQVLFDPGRADLQPGGVQILDLVADALATIPNDIAIEGHTDSKPISTTRFPSNWELSTARATSVLRYLIDAHQLDPTRLSAAGYSDTRPIDDNGTVAGAARNRRVEVVVVSTVSLAPILPAD